ncbi:hypothetical protein T439DRAFT_381255, partial [Meredithblackwellia eburnea MCA 4105]
MSNCGQTTQEEDENPSMPIEPERVTSCIKCSKPAVIQVRSNGYCNECFLLAFSQKFKFGLAPALRRSLQGSVREQMKGKRDPIKRSSVLIAFSGGPSSLAMVELASRFMKEKPKHPKDKRPLMYTSIEVAYIDESGTAGAVDHTEGARKLVEACGFTFVPLKLATVFADSPLSTSLTSPNLDSIQALEPSNSNLPTLLAPLSTTSSASLRASLVQSLLRRTAVDRGHEILLTGESATRVAVKTLAGMSEGRGWSLGEEVGAEWDAEDGRLLVVRPLSSCLQNEVQLFLETVGLKDVSWGNKMETWELDRQAGDKDVKKKGIERLAEDFVLGLQENFPSTVPTVAGTAGKLGMRTADAGAREVADVMCPLCGLPAQSGASEWRNAVTVSTLEAPRTNFASSAPELDSTPTSGDLDSTSIPLGSYLCYGCLLVFEGAQEQARRRGGVGGAVTELQLPGYVGEAARRRQQQTQTKEGHIPKESPFSCFSPSYTETLPRSHAAHNPHSALAQLNADFSPSSTTIASPSSGQKVEFSAKDVGLPKSSTVAGGAGTKVLKRRSYGPGGEKRITKDLIGHPTNFVHEGHVGRPLEGRAAIDLKDTLASVAAALQAPNMSLPSQPSFATRPLATKSLPATPLAGTPLKDNTNSSPAASPAPQPAPTLATMDSSAGVGKRVARKAPPPITQSVIRQAGSEAVFGSEKPAPPVPIISKGSMEEKKQDMLPPVVKGSNLNIPSPTVILGEKEVEAKASPLDELGRRMESDGMGGYITLTTKKRWDGTMAEIEAALAG